MKRETGMQKTAWRDMPGGHSYLGDRFDHCHRFTQLREPAQLLVLEPRLLPVQLPRWQGQVAGPAREQT